MVSKGFPLRPTLVSGVMALILLVAAATGFSAYGSSKRALASLWRGLAGQVAENITDKTLRFLEPAVPYVELTERLAQQGRIDPENRADLLEYFKAAIEANPEFTWASYGDETGTYMAAYRASDNSIEGTWRDQIPERKTTIWRDFSPGPEGRFRPLREKDEHYDPRTRSWYKGALAAPAGGGFWGEPFLFTSRKQPGFFFSRRFEKNGKVRGVFAVQYETKYLSEFLHKIALGQKGRVYVVTRGGQVVGHPYGDVLAMNERGEPDIAHADHHPDAMLRGAWKAWSHDHAERFSFGDYLGLAHEFPKHSGINFVVLGVAPQDDFFGEARRQAMIGVAISGVCLLLAIVFGAFLATRISRALREMSDEMEEIGRFELHDHKLQSQRSILREVNVMGEAAARMKSSLRSFGKYVPTRLVKELMQSGKEAVLGGNKKTLTILFCDIAGFTTISEQMAPEALVAALAEYFAGASDAVHENGGTVDKFIGDAVMAFWGAPQDIDDAPMRACKAALALQAKVHAMSARWQAQGRPRFEVRIGINTGECIVGNIGSLSRMNYTAMGDSVNLASRLEGLNKVYGTKIMLGETTAAAVRGRMLLRSLDFVAVKGKHTASVVHELVGELTDGAPAAAAVLHKAALDLYRGRNFASAAERFAEVEKTLGGHDEAARVMGERCKHYAAEPPPPAWDGSVAMKEK